MTSKKSPYKGKSREELASIIRDESNKEKLAKLFETFKTDSQNDTKETSQQESKLFAKNGGKMQQFICKHGRGGNVDCGCGGMVIRGEDGIDKLPEGTSRIITPRDTTDTYYLPNGNMVESIHPTDGSAPRYRESNPITL